MRQTSLGNLRLRKIETKGSEMLVHYRKAGVALLIMGSIAIHCVFHGRIANGQESWPQFRGVGSLGVGTDAQIPDRYRKRCMENRYSGARMVFASRLEQSDLPDNGNQYWRTRRGEEGVVLWWRAT
jgi:hypothetical protein